MVLSIYVKIYPCSDRPGHNLLFSTRRSAAILLNDALLAAARNGSLPETEGETLARLGFLVPDAAAEREEMRAVFEAANRSRRPFQGMVVLNLDCNLDCGYCYEGNFRGKRYMSAETADLLVRKIEAEQIGRGRDVAITFYGGEPLLSIPLIEDMSVKLGEAARQAGVSYRFGLVTNGTLLTRKVAEALLPLGFSGAKITIDGPQEMHDKSRPFVSGKGSYDRITANMREVMDLVPLRLGGNYSKSAYPHFPRLLDDLAQAGITPEKLQRVLFVPITPKAGSGSADLEGCACASEPWVAEASLYLREEILRRGYATPKIMTTACAIEFASDLVINYDGSLYKCPAFMGYEHLRIGSLREGVGEYGGTHNIDVWKKEECLDCAYLPLCFGGCRFLTLLRTGAIGDVDCRKAYLDATLETIVRQDLRYQRKMN